MNQHSELDPTIEYYNKNSSAFISRTINADMSDAYGRFLELLPEGARVLDAGCGSGRDAKKFTDLGFRVSAFDASEEMVKHASEHAGIEVQQLRFDQLKYKNEFEGVWACASLLHVRKEDFDSELQHLVDALRSGGVLYISMKEGESKVPEGGRHFSYFSACEVEEIVSSHADLDLNYLWVSETPECTWINVLAKRV